ncbi:MAG: hypothetical protein WD059_08705 [Balneolaceae bacterium]
MIRKFVYKTFVITLLMLGSASSSIYAQEASAFFRGLGIEIGGGYNQLLWEATDVDGGKESYDRTAFSLMPSIRISYEFDVFSKINLHPFIGYNEFGGHSKLESVDWFLNSDVLYKDQYRFRNLEFGIYGTYSISRINMGAGFKLNYHLEIEQKNYYENHPQDINGWRTSDNSFLFKDLSLDAGIRLEYPIIQKVKIGAEGWFGITDLGKEEYPIFVRQNHFRLLIGYRF